VEEIGIEVARRYLAAARLVVFCVEAGRPLEPEEEAFLRERAPASVVLVRTKADRAAGPADPASAAAEGHPSVRVSAPHGEGLGELRQILLRAAFGGILGDPGEAPLVTRERQARALRRARGEVRLFLEAWEEGIPPEFAATHLQAAAGALELLGVIGTEDVLDRVFSTFCVGK
jgi:tRNA modification GTPase